MTQRTRGIAFVLTLVLILVMSFSATALAEDTTASIEFTTNENNVLKLVTAPSINFGEKDLPVVATTYSAVDISDLKVSDTRGVWDGWNVKAQLSAFTDGTNQTLNGSKILLSNGTANTNSGSGEPTVIQKIELPAGSQSPALVVDAESNTGIGDWTVSWANDDAQIYVPMATRGMHSATLTWTLSNAPA